MNVDFTVFKEGQPLKTISVGLPVVIGRGTDSSLTIKHPLLSRRHCEVYEEGGQVPIIVRGEGAYVWDDQGRKYLDGLAGLFTVQLGHGREELADAAATQAKELAFFPIWSYAHPRAIELAEQIWVEITENIENNQKN